MQSPQWEIRHDESRRKTATVHELDLSGRGAGRLNNIQLAILVIPLIAPVLILVRHAIARIQPRETFPEVPKRPAPQHSDRCDSHKCRANRPN